MDEDYARLLRDWLRATPGAPRPRGESDDVEIPAPRLSDENRRRSNAGDRTAPADGGDSGPPREPARRTTAEDRGGLALPRDPEDLGETEERTDQESRTAAEERSRWNHPANWHRRKAAERAEIGDRVAEPAEPRWPLRDPDDQAEPPSRRRPLDEQRPWRELDDAIERSRRQELEAARERCRRNHPSNWNRDNRNNDNRNNDNDDPGNRSR
ncbi:hypothetical protein OHS18_34960 [Amycolatopsis sp. NBC_00355]|uniref:hypothetical protein n=1 Tax=Amycolatopsis sp. NBC_00355 TaxID=2975957 RepID=UPI002E27550F